LILLTVSCNCSDSVNSNKDPVCETELHFTEKYQIISKSFEIQFTPSCISAKTVSNNNYFDNFFIINILYGIKELKYSSNCKRKRKSVKGRKNYSSLTLFSSEYLYEE